MQSYHNYSSPEVEVIELLSEGALLTGSGNEKWEETPDQPW